MVCPACCLLLAGFLEAVRLLKRLFTFTVLRGIIFQKTSFHSHCCGDVKINIIKASVLSGQWIDGEIEGEVLHCL
jgi:hypothetical protein